MPSARARPSVGVVFIFQLPAAIVREGVDIVFYFKFSEEMCFF
ncbi:MAG: hypothetical protein ACI92C_001983 [Neolewinella sp.]